MLEEAFLTSVAVRVSVSLVSAIGRPLIEVPAVESAVAATNAAFPDLELEPALKTWVSSEDFQLLIERLSAGDRSLIDESEVVESLVRAGFFLPDSSRQRECAREIIRRYFDEVMQLLYEGTGGLALHARRTEAIREEGQGQLADINAKLSEIQDLVSIRDAAGFDAGATDHVLSVRVDDARNLIKRGQYTTALGLLGDIQSSDEFEHAGDLIRYRVSANLAACQLELGRCDVAVGLLEQALRFKPETADAEANLAAGRYAVGQLIESEVLARKALSRDSNHSQAAAVLIQCLNQTQRFSELDGFLEANSWCRADSQCQLALAVSKLDRDDFLGATELARLAVESDASDALAKMLLATALTEQLQNDRKAQSPFPWMTPPEVRKRLTEALEVFSQVILLTEGREDTARRSDAFISRASIHFRLGELQPARADVEAAIQLDSGNEAALRNLAAIEGAAGNFEASVSALKRIPGWEGRAEIVLEISKGLVSLEQYGEVLTLLLPLWNASDEGWSHRVQLQLAEALLVSGFYAGDQHTCANVSAQLESQPPDSDTLLLVGIHRMRSGNLDAAISDLREALEGASPESEHRVRLALSDALARSDAKGEAFDVLTPIVNESADSWIVERFARLALDAGRVREARQAAEWLCSRNATSALGLEVEAMVLDWIGDPAGAAEARLQLAAAGHNSSHNRVRAAANLWNAGEDERARETLACAVAAGIVDPEDMMGAAQLQAYLDVGDPLDLAYNAAGEAPDDPSIQLGCLFVFLRMEKVDESRLNPEEVTLDTTVTVTRGEERRDITIVLSPTPGNPWEVKPSDALAVRLLGSRVGETVTVKESELEDVEYEVAAIRSKYVARFQTVLTDFSTRFPDHPGLYRVDVGDGDFSRVFASIRSQEDRTTQALDLYDKLPLTLERLGQLLGSNLIDTWAAFPSRDDRVLYSASGHAEDEARQAAALENTDTIALDLSAICTLRSLGLFDVFVARFGRVLAHQSAYDEFRRRTDMSPAAADRRAMTVFSRDHQIYGNEPTEEELRGERDFIESVEEALVGPVERVPATKCLELGRERCDELSGALGRGSTMAILVASAEGIPLFSADQRTCQAAAEVVGVQGISPQAILRHLLAREFIDAEKYRKGVVILAGRNYWPVRLTAGDIVWCLVEEGSVGTTTIRLLSHSLGPRSNDDYAVGLLANLARTAALDLPVGTRTTLLDAALLAICEDRDARLILDRFEQTVSVTMRLLPVHLDEILSTVSLWRQHNSY